MFILLGFLLSGTDDPTSWSFVSGRAERKPEFLEPRPFFTIGEWDIISNQDNFPTDEYDPFDWVGLNELPECPPVR